MQPSPCLALSDCWCCLGSPGRGMGRTVSSHGNASPCSSELPMLCVLILSTDIVFLFPSKAVWVPPQKLSTSFFSSIWLCISFFTVTHHQEQLHIISSIISSYTSSGTSFPIAHYTQFWPLLSEAKFAFCIKTAFNSSSF